MEFLSVVTFLFNKRSWLDRIQTRKAKVQPENFYECTNMEGYENLLLYLLYYNGEMDLKRKYLNMLIR